MRQEIALGVVDAFVPEIGVVAMFIPGASPVNKETNFKEERLRIALALMRDAGYDPWQAPQAWRLLEPDKLPANLALLAYPDASCYQIGILNLQYAQK